MRIILFIRELQCHRHATAIVIPQLFGLHELVEFQQGILVNICNDIDRIHGHYGSEQRGITCVAANVISFREQGAADAAVNRRANDSVFKVQFRGIEQGLGFLVMRLAGIGLLGGDGVSL